MLCDVCKKNVATVHLTQMIEGKTKKVDLCEGCSKEKGVDDPTGFSLADLLLGLGAAQEMEQASSGKEVKCSKCGFSQADFKKAGRFGCPDCYAAFAEGLENLLKSMHKGTQHKGKAPRAYAQSREVKGQLDSLQSQLTKAVAEEQFESAARLRDEINRLRERLNEITTP